VSDMLEIALGNVIKINTILKPQKEQRMIEADPIIRTTGLDRNPCVFLSRKRLCFWDCTKECVYAKEEAIV